MKIEALSESYDMPMGGKSLEILIDGCWLPVSGIGFAGVLSRPGTACWIGGDYFCSPANVWTGTVAEFWKLCQGVPILAGRDGRVLRLAGADPAHANEPVA